MSKWFFSCFCSLYLLFSCGIAISADNQKIEVVWDGFSFPGEPGMKEECDQLLNPSCKLLFSEEYKTRFFNRIVDIEDDKYKFVKFADNEIGETLHLTITINLEWADMADASEIKSLKSDALIGRYRICSSLMLYRADSTRYMLENVVSKCSSKPLLRRDADNLDAFIEGFVRGGDSTKDRNIENDWLAESAQLLVRKRGLHVPIGISDIELSSEIYSTDIIKKERLRLFLAENMSFQLSQAFGKPVIPPTLSAKGQKALRFRDSSRNRSISIWPAAHTLSLKVLPFQQKIVEEKKDLWFEDFFSIVSLSHENALKEKFLDNVGLYTSSSRQLLNMGKTNPESDLMESLIKKQIPADNLERLCKSIASQLVKIDKKWIDQYTYKSDPIVVAKGFARLQKELAK